MKAKQLLLISAALTLLALMPAAAKADPVTLTLTPPGNVLPGNTLHIFGTLANGPVGTVFLNGIDANLVSPPSLAFSFDFGPFFTFVPVSIGPAASTGSVNLFDIIVGPSATVGTYTFSVTIFGGNDASAQNILATKEFNVRVVPEPASMLLLVSGLGGIVALARARKQKNFGGSSR